MTLRSGDSGKRDCSASSSCPVVGRRHNAPVAAMYLSALWRRATPTLSEEENRIIIVTLLFYLAPGATSSSDACACRCLPSSAGVPPEPQLRRCRPRWNDPRWVEREQLTEVAVTEAVDVHCRRHPWEKVDVLKPRLRRRHSHHIITSGILIVVTRAPFLPQQRSALCGAPCCGSRLEVRQVSDPLRRALEQRGVHRVEATDRRKEVDVGLRHPEHTPQRE